MKRAFVCAALILPSAGLLAGTASVTKTTDDPAGQSALTNGVWWTDKDNWTSGTTSGTDPWTGWQQPDADTDYVIANGKIVRVPRFTNYKFIGKSLKIGDGGKAGTLANGNPNANNNVCHYPPTTLEYGNFSNYYGTQVEFYGDFNLTAVTNNKGEARIVMTTNNQIVPPKASFVFHDSFSGNADALMQISVTGYKDADPYNNCPSTNSIYRFACDLRGFKSTVRVRPWTNKNRDVLIPGDARACNAPRRVVFSVTKDTVGPMPGAIETWSGSSVELYDADTQFSVATLDLSGNDLLDFTCDCAAKKCGLLTVTQSLVQRRYGKTLVRLRRSGTDDGSPVKYPLLKAPAGVTLDLNDFELENLCAITASSRTYSLSVSTDTDGLSTLWIGHGTIVTLSKDDANNVAESFRRGDNAATVTNHWSDLQWPSAGKDYVVVGKTIRSPAQANDAATGNTNSNDFSFLGDSLTLIRSTLVCRSSNAIEIPDLRLVGDTGETKISHYATGKTGVWPNNQNGMCVLKGHATYKASPEKALRFMLSNDRGLRYEMDFRGDGPWTVAGYCEQNSANKPNGHHWFSSLNTNAYPDRVLLSYDYTTWPAAMSVTKQDIPVPNLDYNCHVYIDDPRCLGGTLPTFTVNALEIRDYSTLWPTKSMRFSDQTRGIRIGTSGVANKYHVAQLMVTNSLTLGIDVPVNWDAATSEIYKRGGGTLDLAKAPTFSGGTDGCPRSGAANRLRICEGTLKASAYDAVDGLNLVFSNGTKLVVATNLKDENFVKYGVINNLYRTGRTSPAYAASFAGHPLSLEGCTKLSVELDGLGEKPPKSVAILSVGEEYADAVGTMLDVANGYDGTYQMAIVRKTVDAPSGGGKLVTFSAEFKRGGLLLVK